MLTTFIFQQQRERKKMSLSLVPDTYSPNVDNCGRYIDYTPSFSGICGIKCPCGSRKDKYFSSASSLSSHQKTKIHQSWLSSLNLNKANFYAKTISLEETVRLQQQILVQMQNEIQIKSKTIDYLTELLNSKNTPSDCSMKKSLDLIDFC
jgi:hypothetical protein